MVSEAIFNAFWFRGNIFLVSLEVLEIDQIVSFSIPSPHRFISPLFSCRNPHFNDDLCSLTSQSSYSLSKHWNLSKVIAILHRKVLLMQLHISFIYIISPNFPVLVQSPIFSCMINVGKMKEADIHGSSAQFSCFIHDSLIRKVVNKHRDIHTMTIVGRIGRKIVESEELLFLGPKLMHPLIETEG